MKEQFENYRKKGYQSHDIFIMMGVTCKYKKEEILKEVYPKAKHPLMKLFSFSLN